MHAQRLVLSALLVGAAVGVMTGCPTTPTCPTCSTHQATYTVGTYPEEIKQGYAITAARLTQSVNYRSHCPSGGAPPCSETSAWSVMPAVPGERYDVTLRLATDHALGDVEVVTVDFTLTKSGSPTLVKSVTATVH